MKISSRLKKQFAAATVAVATLLFAFTGCGDKDESSKSDENTATIIANKTVELTWNCLGNRPDKSGLNSQEEYCEWTRNSRTLDKGLQCEFNSNFDGTRPHFLTKNELNPLFNQTFANSQQFLVGGKEPTGQVREGIVASCIKRKGVCQGPGCVCGRKSDPQICAVIGTMVKNGCGVGLDAPAAKTVRTPTGKEEPKPIVALQIRIPQSLAANCFYKNQRLPNGTDVVIPGMDPAKEQTYVRCYFNPNTMPNIKKCDDVAKSLTIVTRIQAQGTCNFNAVAAALDGKTPNACQ
jgi:hypothetical protein